MNRRQMITGTAALVGLGAAGCCSPTNVTVVDDDKCPCPPAVKKPPETHELHICAFHIYRERISPKWVPPIETQHYCSPLSDEIFQCVLYDSTGKNARILGVEYVISERLYNTLSKQEKKLWHPHEFEIREGLLTTPGLPKECEQKTMKALLRSYGKTWHTWPDPKTQIPLGRPELMWSAEVPGEVPPEMIDERDRRFKLCSKRLKKQRKEYLP